MESTIGTTSDPGYTAMMAFFDMVVETRNLNELLALKFAERIAAFCVLRSQVKDTLPIYEPIHPHLIVVKQFLADKNIDINICDTREVIALLINANPTPTPARILSICN